MNTPSASSNALSSEELELVTEFLSNYEDVCVNHSSNDFFCPMTDDNKAILRAAIWHNESDEEERSKMIESMNYSEEELFIFDFWLVGYLAARCQTLLKKPDENSQLNGSELKMIAHVLEWMSDEYEEYFSPGGEHEFIQFATPENKAFYADVIKQQGGAESESELKKLLAADDEITVPDFWVMRYFSTRCKAYAHSSVIQKKY